MNSRQFGTYEDMCGTIAAEIINCLKDQPELLLCIAAGHTSLGVFETLCAAHRDGRADFSRSAFVAMDEWLGMSEQTPESCGAFLNENFLKRVNFRPERVRLFNGTTADPEAECRSVEAFIAEQSTHGVIDYLVLGSGMNGHLALNEPGTPFDSGAHVTHLDTVTQEVGQKYFRKATALTGGLTLGIADFQRARRSVLMVSGEHKREILLQILNREPDQSIPATAVKTFRNYSIYFDIAVHE